MKYRNKEHLNESKNFYFSVKYNFLCILYIFKFIIVLDIDLLLI